MREEGRVGPEQDTGQCVNLLGEKDFYLSDKIFQLLSKRRGHSSAEMGE